MRILLMLMLSIFAVSSYSQTISELEIRERFWGENDQFKEIPDIPEKWAGESAVILFKEEFYDFHSLFHKLKYIRASRRQIKLMDIAAVKEFSEFNFTKRFQARKFSWTLVANDIFVFGLKVIKPDGSEIILNTSEEAVMVDDKPKLAIPGLEVGDVIDFYTYYEDREEYTLSSTFESIGGPFSEEYPIVNFKLFIETENDFFIRFNTYNGAPELKRLNPEKNSNRQYELLIKDIEKINIERWLYPMVELPAYRMHVYYAKNKTLKNRSSKFLPEKAKTILQRVSKEQFMEEYEDTFDFKRDLDEIQEYYDRLANMSKREKLRATYNFMRYQYNTRFNQANTLYSAKIISSPTAYLPKSTKTIFFNADFIGYFSKFLMENNIDFNIVATVPRNTGTIKNLLFKSDVRWFIEIGLESPLYIEYIMDNKSFGHMNSLYEGTDVYLLKTDNKKLISIQDGETPVSETADNEIKSVINLELSNSLNTINYKAKYQIKGIEKLQHQDSLMLDQDYIYEDQAKYKSPMYFDLIKKRKNLSELKAEYDKIMNSKEQKRKESLTHYASVRMNVEDNQDIDNYNFKVISTGRYKLEDYFTYTEDFETDNKFLNKAGENHLFQIGKFIGEQVEIGNKDRQRNENIYINNPKTIINEIELNIPEGYSIMGIEQLNSSIENKTGAFISTAIIENNVLKIKTKKIHKNNFEPAENWPLMLEFLDAAFQFTNEKILIKKI